jgi:hypothetical protein
VAASAFPFLLSAFPFRPVPGKANQAKLSLIKPNKGKIEENK